MVDMTAEQCKDDSIASNHRPLCNPQQELTGIPAIFGATARGIERSLTLPLGVRLAEALKQIALGGDTTCEFL